MAGILTRLRRLVADRRQRAPGQAMVAREPRVVDGSAEHRWAVVESGPPAIGGMYASLLRQQGIPVLVQQWEPGSAALGGAMVGVRVLVPESRLAEARDLLGNDTGDVEVENEG